MINADCVKVSGHKSSHVTFLPMRLERFFLHLELRTTSKSLESSTMGTGVTQGHFYKSS